MLHESFGTLTQLNQLFLSGILPTSALRPVMGLPELDYLSIFLKDEKSGASASLFLQSTHLTMLDVEGQHFSKLSVRALSHVLAAGKSAHKMREEKPD